MADPITAPATLSVKNVSRTMIAKATRDRCSFALDCFEGLADGVSAFKGER